MIYYGQVDRTIIQEILQKCSVGLVTLHPTPSYKEAYPIKMFEYLAAGCAVVASDFPLYRTLLQDASCGIFVDPKNELEIAQVLRELSSNKEQTLASGKSARASFEANYNWEIETQTLSAFYLSI